MCRPIADLKGEFNLAEALQKKQVNRLRLTQGHVTYNG